MSPAEKIWLAFKVAGGVYLIICTLLVVVFVAAVAVEYLRDEVRSWRRGGDLPDDVFRRIGDYTGGSAAE